MTTTCPIPYQTIDTDGDGVPDDVDDCPNYFGSLANGCDPTETSCNDGVDNDGDGLVDCNDPDCDADTNCITCNAGSVAPILIQN